MFHQHTSTRNLGGDWPWLFQTKLNLTQRRPEGGLYFRSVAAWVGWIDWLHHFTGQLLVWFQWIKTSVWMNVFLSQPDQQGGSWYEPSWAGFKPTCISLPSNYGCPASWWWAYYRDKSLESCLYCDLPVQCNSYILLSVTCTRLISYQISSDTYIWY